MVLVGHAFFEVYPHIEGHEGSVNHDHMAQHLATCYRLLDLMTSLCWCFCRDHKRILNRSLTIRDARCCFVGSLLTVVQVRGAAITVV